MDVQIDLLFADSDYHREALARRFAADLPDVGIQIQVLTCEDLILHKLLAGRILDQSDAASLLRVNRASLDMVYLHKWVGALDLADQYQTVWSEAFPQEKFRHM